jgi:hypothetical protein
VVQVDVNPLRLANKIDAALAKYGLGSDRRMRRSPSYASLLNACLRRPADERPPVKGGQSSGHVPR